MEAITAAEMALVTFASCSPTETPLVQLQEKIAYNLIQALCAQGQSVLTISSAADAEAFHRRVISVMGEHEKIFTPERLALAQQAIAALQYRIATRMEPDDDQALRRAAAWGYLFELKVLIKSMATGELNKQDAMAERTALHWAVQGKHLDCARTLVKAGALLDIKDINGQTPLHKAVAHGDREMIKMLIETGASVDTPDNDQKSPRDCAPDSGVLFFINDCHEQANALVLHLL